MHHVFIKSRFKYFISAILLAIGLLGLSLPLQSEKPKEPVIQEPAKLTVYELPITLVEASGKLSKDLIAKHLSAAKISGVGVLKDLSAISSKTKSETLIEVEPDKGYVIGNMTHSYPYLTPEALLTLRTIGASFHKASGDNSYFTVSSLTRTEHTQKKLRKRNSNAAKGVSTHCYGVSFDISYIRYNGVREWSYERTKALEGVLAAMQKSGKIYVLKERNQSCFHITVRSDN